MADIEQRTHLAIGKPKACVWECACFVNAILASRWEASVLVRMHTSMYASRPSAAIRSQPLASDTCLTVR